MREQSTNKGFAILSAAGMIVKVISVLYIPFLMSIIGDEGYGIYYGAYNIYTFIYVLTNSGIPVAISKLVSELMAVENYQDAVKSFKIARAILIILGFIMASIMFLFAHGIARVTGFEKSYYAILALAPTVFITSVLSAYRGYFQGRANMTPTAVSQIIEHIANTILSLSFAYYFMKKYGVELGCAGGTIGTSIGAFLAAIYLVYIYNKYKIIRVPKGYKEKNIHRFTNKQLIRKILIYGIPITLCIGLQYAGNLVDMFNIKDRLLFAGFTDKVANIKYGILGKYNTLINVPITLISALAAAVLPSISGAAALRNKHLIEENTNNAFHFCFLVAMPSAVGLAVLSRPIFRFLFPQYIDGYTLMTFGSAVLILMAVVQIQTTILQGLGKLYTVTLYLILGIISKVIINYILVGVTDINILGAIVGNFFCFLIPLMLNHILIKRSLKINVKLIKLALKPFLASIIMGIVSLGTYEFIYYILKFIIRDYLSNAIALLISVIMSALIYFYVLVIQGGLTRKDLESISPKLLKIVPKRLTKNML